MDYHSRLPCPSLSPGLCSKSCPLSQWCHPAISFSVAPFSPHPQSFPASGSFPRSRLFASGGQSIGASSSALVLPTNVQGWFPLGLTGLISLLSKGLSRVEKYVFGIRPSKGGILPWVLSCLSRVRVCDSMDWSPPVSSIHGILQATWPFSGPFILNGSSQSPHPSQCSWVKLLDISWLSGFIGPFPESILFSLSTAVQRHWLPSRAHPWSLTLHLFEIHKISCSISRTF